MILFHTFFVYDQFGEC